VDIREVARISGVSVATVSRALNDRPDVSSATRERVLQVARDLGYNPNQQARTLVRRRSDTVGLIWDTSYVRAGRRHPFLQDLAVAVKTALSTAGYHLMVLSPEADGADDAFVRASRQHSLDGVAVMGVDERHPAVRALVEAGQPCVGLDIALDGERAGHVSSDNEGGARQAVRHLHGLGHRRIAVVTGPLDLMPAVERLDGFRSEAAALGLSVPDELVVEGDFFLGSGRRAMQRLIALEQPPTAVFVCGDEMAIGALHALDDAGRRAPNDVSVVGFDDLESAAQVRPGLTTVRQDAMALGAAAVQLLVDLMGSEHPQHGRRQVPTELVVRASSGPPPSTL
jgi:LacI family transcriptional regulator